MKRALETAALLLPLFLLGQASAAEDRVLLVGVGDYAMPDADLPGIDKDMGLAIHTARLMGFEDDQIRILFNEQATLQAIRASFRDWLYQASEPGDRALFYFSGHGTFLPDTSGDEDDRVDEALLPQNFEATRRGLRNVLMDDELGQLLDGIPTRQVFVFLDACHSGTATRELGGGEYVSKFYAWEGMPVPEASSTRSLARSLMNERHMVLTAANSDERALASPHGGLFTLGVAAAVDYASENQIRLSPRELRDVVEAFLTKVLEQAPSKMYHPQVYGPAALLDADILGRDGQLASAAPIAPPQVEAPPIPEPAPAPVTAPGTVAPEPPPAPVPAPVPAPAPAPAPVPVAAPEPAPNAQPVAAPMPATPPAPVPAPSAPAPPPELAPPPDPPPSSVDADGGVTAREELESLAAGATWTIQVDPHKDTYRVGEDLVFDVEVDGAGYLNVLSVGASDEVTVLFPNRYRPDNQLDARGRVTIPGPGALFKLPAELPDGSDGEQALLVAIHTRHRVNAFETGSGEGFLRQLSSPATRAFAVAAAKGRDESYGAGTATLEVRR